MTEPTDAVTKETYEAAIRSFTEAEIALREIVAALQRYRSASDTVVEAGGTLNASRDALLATLETLETTSAEMVRLSSSLGQATAVVAALDPERFWASFAQLGADARSSSEQVVQSLVASTSRLDVAVADSSKVLGDRIADAAADLTASSRASADEISLAVSQVRRIAIQARAAAVAAVVLGITAIVMVAVQLLR